MASVVQELDILTFQSFGNSLVFTERLIAHPNATDSTLEKVSPKERRIDIVRLKYFLIQVHKSTSQGNLIVGHGEAFFTILG